MSNTIGVRKRKLFADNTWRASTGLAIGVVVWLWFVGFTSQGRTLAVTIVGSQEIDRYSFVDMTNTYGRNAALATLACALLVLVLPKKFARAADGAWMVVSVVIAVAVVPLLTQDRTYQVDASNRQVLPLVLLAAVGLTLSTIGLRSALASKESVS